MQLLTDSSSIPLLSDTCIHFISIILSERGVNDGQDSYPVFHVTPVSTLAHTVAKLVATRSHRMWIVDQPSPAGSVPPSPGFQPAAHPFSAQGSHSQNSRPITLDDPTKHERTSVRRYQFDRRSKSLRSRKRPVTQGSRRGTPKATTLQLELPTAQHGQLAKQHRSGSQSER
jgi:hypothetical protein